MELRKMINLVWERVLSFEFLLNRKTRDIPKQNEVQEHMLNTQNGHMGTMVVTN